MKRLARRAKSDSHQGPIHRGFLLAPTCTVPALPSSGECIRKTAAELNILALRHYRTLICINSNKRTWKIIHALCHSQFSRCFPTTNLCICKVIPWLPLYSRAESTQWIPQYICKPYRANLWMLYFRISLAVGWAVYLWGISAVFQSRVRTA